MAHSSVVANRTVGVARTAARRLTPWVERLARVGFVADAVVYLLIGALAARAALGVGGKATDPQGALRVIVGRPFGQVMLAIIGLGFFGYAAWQTIAAATNAEGDGTGARGVALRVCRLWTALVYVALGLLSFRLLRGASNGGSGGVREWAARLWSWPLGRWLVGIIGAGVVAYAVYQLYCAWTARVRERLNLTELSNDAAQWVVRLGRFGVAARGVVLALVGWFLVHAAVSHDWHYASGFSGALRVLARQAHGAWLFGAVAFGLVAYGLYQLVQARYRRIAVT
jgi:Domain of Unknown Function (DUF1206)